MISENDFNEFVETLISEKDKENYQKSKKRTTLLLSTIIPLEILVAIVLIISTSSMSIPFFVIFFVVVIISTWAIISKTSGFNWGKYKAEKISQILDFMLKDYQYSYLQHGSISSNYYKLSGLGSAFYDRYYGEDFLSVNIPNEDGSASVFLRLCDLNITRQHTHTDSKGHTHTTTETVFKGVFAYVEFPQNFKCTLGLNHKRSGTKKIQLEDIKYNQIFSVYTDNELEAYRILTPIMMNKLIEFNNKTKKTKVAIFDNYMFLALENMNLFEFKNKPSLNAESFNGFYHDLERILLLVEEIKNNKKIFKIQKNN